MPSLYWVTKDPVDGVHILVCDGNETVELDWPLEIHDLPSPQANWATSPALARHVALGILYHHINDLEVACMLRQDFGRKVIARQSIHGFHLASEAIEIWIGDWVNHDAQVAEVACYAKH